MLFPSKHCKLFIFFMSYFDPYFLYSHPQRKSHKGQVIQKKPTDVPYGFNDQDLKRAITIVTNYGYYISRTPPPSYPNRLTLAYSVQVSNTTDSSSHTFSIDDFLQIDNSIRNILSTTYPFLSTLQSVSAINVIIQVPNLIFSHSIVSSQTETIFEFTDVPNNRVISYSLPANYGPVYTVLRPGNSTGTALTMDTTLANYSMLDPVDSITFPNVLPSHIGGIIFNYPHSFEGDEANAFLSYLQSDTLYSGPTETLFRLDTNQGVFTDSVSTACISVEIVI